MGIIKEYWDVFCEEGLRNNIRGFIFRVDTGNFQPVCCKTPRYGHHETGPINTLLQRLEDNGLIEDDFGPWGAQIVLAAKANQEGVSYKDYQWRLCVSYRRLNTITRPYAYPIPRCDDAVTDIGPEARYFIKLDLDSGYWQVTVEKQSRDRLAFFTPTGKKHFNAMPMGVLNAQPVFVAMMNTIQAEWIQKTLEAGIPNCGSKVIVDDILLHAYTIPHLFTFFRIVLHTLRHYRATVKLKKCKFLPNRCEFVGVDILPEGNSPEQSKYNVFANLPCPATWSDLRMVIGMFGFYGQWLQNYEVRIRPWRDLQKLQPNPGTLTQEEEQESFTQLWTN